MVGPTEDEPPGEPTAQTVVACATQLIPSRPIPGRLVLLLERMVILRGVRGFLDSCVKK